MRKLASIQKIINVSPIEGADAIEKISVLGWHCVSKKGEFKVGDFCVYFEVDSMLQRAEWNEFLFKPDDGKTEFRLKTIRLRGQVSQGLVVPISVIKNDNSSYLIVEGEDLTESLAVAKYEAPIPAQLQGTMKGERPHFVPKTDETRIQAEPEVLNRYHGKDFYITEKIDGSSMSAYLHDGVFGVCSRKIDLKETEGNSFWKVARALDMENRLTSLGYNVVIQGEIHGEGIQGNKYKLKGQDFVAFNVYNCDNGKYLNYGDFISVCSNLNIKTVPMLCVTTLVYSIDQLVKYSEGASILNPETQREGIVLRPVEEMRDPDLGRLSFKVINPKFLLKHGE